MIQELIPSKRSIKQTTEVNEVDFLQNLEDNKPLKKKDLSNGSFITSVVFNKLYIKQFNEEKVAYVDVQIKIDGKTKTLTLDRTDATTVLYLFKGKYPNEKSFKDKEINVSITITPEVFIKDGKQIDFKKIEISHANINNQ